MIGGAFPASAHLKLRSDFKAPGLRVFGPRACHWVDRALQYWAGPRGILTISDCWVYGTCRSISQRPGLVLVLAFIRTGVYESSGTYL